MTTNREALSVDTSLLLLLGGSILCLHQKLLQACICLYDIVEAGIFEGMEDAVLFVQTPTPRECPGRWSSVSKE